MQNAVTTYLTYANLQMAAESLFGVTLSDSPGVVKGSSSMSQASLMLGNNRSSKFTQAQAEQFLREWQVVEHKSNTSTGFSGTLFKYAGQDDPSRGLVNGQLVMSFRSTEFIDDAARDNQATNAMEVAQGGWAMGQIADMENWFNTLNQPGGALAGRTFSVTGYSLGGHLATAFNLLHQGEGRITATYTFNGAGVGTVNADKSLAAIVQRFNAQRKNVDGNQIVFSDTAARTTYRELRSRLTGGVAPTEQDIQGVLRVMQNGLMDNAQGALLVSAMKRIQVIMTEAARVPTLSSGSASSAPPTNVSASQIEATRLDYQLAVLIAQRSTQALSVAGGGLNTATDSRNTRGPLANFYDLYGATYPSAVANSQYHYGTATPVFIEDQPLYRGTVISDAVRASFEAFDVRLLVNGYSQNDFGDTHSLVLMIDSLSVQEALIKLDSQASTSTINQILQAASNVRAAADGSNNGQGRAEGDVLEHVLDGLRRTLLGPSMPETQANMSGGTWANFADRNVFHDRLAALLNSQTFKDLAGKVTLSSAAGNGSLPSQARSEFGALLALTTLSPFVLTARSAADAAAVESALSQAWGSTYTDWLADKNALAQGQDRAQLNLSDTWLNDRQALLQWQLVRNVRNLEGNTITGAMAGQTIAEATNFEDRATRTQILVGAADQVNQRVQVIFGGAGADTLSGFGRNDRLYGGEGNDTINGQGGADWLEGNAGADTLDGGQGNDTLLGGAGSDLYRFTANWGADVIRDAGGQGRIEVEGVGSINGAGVKQVAVDAWQTDDKRVNYTLVAVSATRRDLIVSFSDRADTITIENWSRERSLGINLPTTTAPAPAPANTYVGDYRRGTSSSDPTRYEFVGDNYRNDGALPNADDALTGSASADVMSGLGGNDALSGQSGADRIDGGAGSDLLFGGLGRDTLSGGAGNDFIFGSGYGELFRPERTTQPQPEAKGPELARGFSWVVYENTVVDANGIKTWVVGGADGDTVLNDDGNVIDAGAGDDRVSAGSGRDTVHGGDGKDRLEGRGVLMREGSRPRRHAGCSRAWPASRMNAGPAVDASAWLRACVANDSLEQQTSAENRSEACWA